MNLIELHILQSFPVTCLNRDDVGAPKSAMFGGAERARVSSQCWKRAIRLLAHDDMPSLFGGMRTKYIAGKFEKIFLALKEPEERAHQLAILAANAVGQLDSVEDGKVKTLVFFTQNELEAVAKLVAEAHIPDDEVKSAFEALGGKAKAGKAKAGMKSAIEKAVKGLGAKTKDAADIALFGRMVASDPSLTMEGAAMFSHAISTHAVSSGLDFFTAVDDVKKADDESDAGAGHMGTLEFNSACYYRYVGINVDLLRANLGDALFTPDEIRAVLRTFLGAVVKAVPSARRNSMFGNTLPNYVLGLRRRGQPLSLVNAFETPVASGAAGYSKPSIAALKAHWGALKKTYDLAPSVEAELPGQLTMSQLIDSLTREE